MDTDTASVTVQAYDPAPHTGSSRDGHCGQGGKDTCAAAPEFSVRSPAHTIATCEKHLPGAVRQAARMPRRRG